MSAMAKFARLVAARPSTSPWVHVVGDDPRFAPDDVALTELLAVPVGEGATSQSGLLARAVDTWVAFELRRAGFDADEVWPRPERPHVLPRDLALFLRPLNEDDRKRAEEAIAENRAVAPTNAKILGRAYMKQVDVVIAQWSRGPELLVSTKSMVSSFRNNLANRFEEAYGDARNLRGRHPLAALGFVMLLHADALERKGTIERVIDMLRKLSEDKEVYDATCLIIAGWQEPPAFTSVNLRDDRVPQDLGRAAFFSTMIGAMLARTPVDLHQRVRRLRDRLELEPAEDEE